MVFLFISQRKKRKNDVLRFFRKRVVGTGDARPFLAAKGFFRQPYVILLFFLSKAMKKAASFDAALCFIVCLPKHKALVVGFRSLALLERILPVSRRDTRDVQESRLAAALLNHLVDIVFDVRLIQP